MEALRRILDAMKYNLEHFSEIMEKLTYQAAGLWKT